MSKKVGRAIFIALEIGALILSYVLWGWQGFITAALVIVLIEVSTEIEAKVRRKADRETSRKYGAYGEVEISNYPAPDPRAPEVPTDNPGT